MSGICVKLLIEKEMCSLLSLLLRANHSALKRRPIMVSKEWDILL